MKESSLPSICTLLLSEPSKHQSVVFCPTPKPQEYTRAKFTCFPRFPLEIRRLIWELSLEERTAPRHLLNRSFIVRDNYAGSSLFTIHALDVTIPITLSVNQESRTETLHHYKDLLIQNPSVLPDPVCFNLELDTLNFRSYYRNGFVPARRKYGMYPDFDRRRDISNYLLEPAALAPSAPKLVESHRLCTPTLELGTLQLSTMCEFSAPVWFIETGHYTNVQVEEKPSSQETTDTASASNSENREESDDEEDEGRMQRG